MLVNDILIASTNKGMGIVAARYFPKGTIIWLPCLKCRIWDVSEQKLMSADEITRLDEFGYRLKDQSIILPCNNAHLLNHSCDASVLDYGLDFGIAIRDIEMGDEITCDYRQFTADPHWVFECRCDSENCIEIITPSAVSDELKKEWKKKIYNALKFAPIVPQPLEKTLVADSYVYNMLRKGKFNYNKSLNSNSIIWPRLLMKKIKQ